MTIGYGDFFVAALAGAIASRQPSLQAVVALATTAFALAQYALSSDGDLLPATAPVAVALVVAAVVARVRRRRPLVAAAPAI
jgi:CHASE2 domain-containing sensor protein